MNTDFFACYVAPARIIRAKFGGDIYSDTAGLSADNGYDAQEFVEVCLKMAVIPHVAQNTSGQRSAAPDAIARSEAYAILQQKRKLIEQGFG